MKWFSIRARLMALAGAGALITGLIGSVGYQGLGQAIHDSQQLEDSAVAVRAAMTADMKHDSIRAEVFRASLAAASGDRALLQRAGQAVAADVQALREGLSAAAQRAPTADAREAVRLAQAEAGRYGDAALAALAAMAARPAAHAQALADFDPAFKALEATLAQLGDQIEHSAAEVSAQAHQRGGQARGLMLAVGLGGLAGLLALSAWLVSAILTPLEALRRAVMQLNQIDGDLSRRLPPAAAEFGEVSSQFNQFLGKIADVVGQVQAAAREVSVASGQIAAGNQDLSLRTDRTAAGLQQAVAHVDEIEQHLQQGADAALQARDLAGSASAVAARGGLAVGRVVSTMDGINEASRRIHHIVGVIDGIAFQTNILALNAAVEASRAGPQGQGFAVVADEVRTLAGRSADAAQQIRALVEGNVAQVEVGTRLVQAAGSTMGEIVDSVNQVQAMIETVSRAAGGQREGMGRVNRTVVGLDESTRQNAALVEQTAAAAAQVAQQAQVLVETVGVFRTWR